MDLLGLLKKLVTSDCKKDLVYDHHIKDSEGNTLFLWYVYDANHGYNVFSYQKPDDEDTSPVFHNWFSDKNLAIEYALDSARAEKLVKGL